MTNVNYNVCWELNCFPGVNLDKYAAEGVEISAGSDHLLYFV